MTGNGLRQLRRLAGVSQEKLARLIGVSPATISRWERGNRRIAPVVALGIRAAVAEYLEQRNK